LPTTTSQDQQQPRVASHALVLHGD
jgi:hypothetical protein